MPKSAKFDPVATAGMSFKDPRSFVAIDGRWILSGQDMSEMRLKVFERDGEACVDCGSSLWLQLSHEVRKSYLRDDRAENLKTRCVWCHRKKDGHGAPLHF